MDLTAIGLFLLNLTPALIIGILTLLFVPKSMRLLRILVYILLLVLVRDRFLTSGGEIFVSLNILLYSIVPLLIIAAAIFYETEIVGLIIWTKDNIPRVIIAGVIGALAIGLPVFLAHRFLPAASGLFNGSLEMLPYITLPLLAIVALEEIVFQGFLQGYLEEHIGIAKSAVISGLFFIFSYCLVSHYISLENTFLLLLFIILQGFIVAQLQVRYGVVAGIIARSVSLLLVFSGVI